LAKKDGSVKRVTEDLSLLKLRQKSEVKKACISLLLPESNKTIQLAHSSSSEELLNSMHVKAHDVRAISTSWALFNNASLDEVLSAGFWRTQNSFISHYLQSLSSQAQTEVLR
jgi:hypothetical protein